MGKQGFPHPFYKLCNYAPIILSIKRNIAYGDGVSDCIRVSAA